MNLFDHRLWEETKIWVIVFTSLLFVFLFINPIISLVILFIIIARLIYVKLVVLVFNKAIAQSEEDFEDKLYKMTTNIRGKLAIWEINEILKLTKDFPGCFIDFINEEKYVVTYRNKSAYFQNISEAREWLVNF